MDRMCWTIQTDSDELFFLTEPDVELFKWTELSKFGFLMKSLTLAYALVFLPLRAFWRLMKIIISQLFHIPKKIKMSFVYE